MYVCVCVYTHAHTYLCKCSHTHMNLCFKIRTEKKLNPHSKCEFQNIPLV